MKKFIKIISVLLCIAMFGAIFIGCDKDIKKPGGGIFDDIDPDGGDGTTVNNFIMEAEYLDLSNTIGSGWSDSAMDTQMIQPDTGKLGASNGYMVGFLHSENIVLKFEFLSDKDTTGKFVIRLASEIGDVNFTKNEFSISMNDVDIDYGSFYIPGGSDFMVCGVFANFVVTEKLNIVKGKNIIYLEVLANEFMGGRTGGPQVDCLRISSDANLSWTPKISNIK